jgi:hypothetical protein
VENKGPAANLLLLEKGPFTFAPLVVGVPLDGKAELRVLLQKLEHAAKGRSRLGLEDVGTGVEKDALGDDAGRFQRAWS